MCCQIFPLSLSRTSYGLWWWIFKRYVHAACFIKATEGKIIHQGFICWFDFSRLKCHKQHTVHSFTSPSHSFWNNLCPLHMCLSFIAPQPTQIHTSTVHTQQKHTSPAFKDIIDLSEQQSHVTELRLPGLTENLQVLLRYLTGRVEGQRLGCWDDLSLKLKRVWRIVSGERNN